MDPLKVNVQLLIEKSKELRRRFALSRIKLASSVERLELYVESSKEHPWPASEEVCGKA